MSLRVFQPDVSEGFEWVQPVDEEDFDTVYQLDGTPLAARWTPIRVRRLEADETGKPWLPSDLPWLGQHALVFREAARQAVGELLVETGEFLKLDLVDGSDQLWLFNVCRVIDALDEAASDVVRFPSTGRIMTVKRHVFHADLVAGLAAFRVPQARSLFLSGEVVDEIRTANLRGARFELVWRS